MKVILINTPKGQYHLPLLLIAEDRANYYASKGGYLPDAQDYIDDVSLVMNDSYEGIDWLINNFNWEDWELLASKVNDDVKVSEDDFWTSSDDFEIVNI